MIPRIIHQTTGWPELPAWCAALRKRVEELHPSWDVRLYDDAACRNVVARGMPELLPIYDAYERVIQRVDMFRVVVVYVEGGFYLDIDMESHAPLDPLLANRCVLGEEKTLAPEEARALGHTDRLRIANYLFGAEPRHPFMRDLLLEMSRRSARTLLHEEDVLETTGPALVTDVYHQRKHAYDDVTVVPNGGIRCPRCLQPWCQFGHYATHRHVGFWRNDFTQRSLPSSTTKPRINLYADFNDRGGWGRQARGFGAALQRHIDVALCPTNPAERGDHSPDGDVRISLADEQLPDATRVVLGPLSWIRCREILSTVWETTRVPEHGRGVLAAAHTIWVPTHWGKDVFIDNGVPEEKLRVVPEGVDTALFRPAPERPEGRDVFRFVSVGKWEERKGQRDLIRAFANEFRPDEPVELVMHSGNIYEDIDVGEQIARALDAAGGKAPPVVSSPQGELLDLIVLMQNSDAFVLPTRAEGWGLPILEAMACGLPCIVTDYSGHRAFAHETNAYLISVEKHIPAHDSDRQVGTFAQPSIDHLQELMRHVFEHREEAAAMGKTARWSAERWSWDNAAREAIRQL